MTRLLLACIAVLTTAALLSQDAAAARRRVVITPRPYYYSFDEPGAIYGYAPGVYREGPTGLLYGPYPPYPRPRVIELPYPRGWELPY